MKCLPQVQSFSNYVIECGWRCTATDADDTVSAQGSCSFLRSDISPKFTPYDDLTEEQVLGWCWNAGVNKVDIESSLQNQLEEMKAAPVVNVLPWS